jgi:hypothetical protein
VCLLVISTTLAQGSFQITALQQGNAALAQQQQELAQQVAQDEAPGTIEQRARQLGMVPLGELRFINLTSGRVDAYTAGSAGARAAAAVPGYSP